MTCVVAQPAVAARRAVHLSSLPDLPLLASACKVYADVISVLGSENISEVHLIPFFFPFSFPFFSVYFLLNLDTRFAGELLQQ